MFLCDDCHNPEAHKLPPELEENITQAIARLVAEHDTGRDWHNLTPDPGLNERYRQEAKRVAYSRGRCEGCGKMAACIDCHFQQCGAASMKVPKA